MFMFVATVSLWGSGFQIVEQGASNMGTALAGAAVNANNDASAAYWNPAAGFFVKSDGKIDFAGSFIIPAMTFKGSATYPNGNEVYGDKVADAGKLAFVPNFFLIRKITDDLLVSVSLTAPFGLETRYDNEFVGRMHGIKSNVTTLEFNPSIAYKVTDWFSVAAGASVNYVHAELTSTADPTNAGVVAAEFNARAAGQGWTGSFNVGAAFKFLETGRLGVSYRHRISHDVEGALRLKHPSGTAINYDVTAAVDLPSVITAGIYYRFKEELSPFAVMFDYSWTQWSLFDALTFVDSSSGTVVSNTPENWRNTSRFSIGMHYHPTWDEDLVFRVGLTYDETPVRNKHERTPRIPDADRLWVSCGLGYQIDWLNIDIAYTYIFFNNVSMDHTHPSYGNVKGDYSGHAHVLSLQAGISW